MNYPLTEKEKLAWSFAEEKHKGQVRRFTDKPYFEAHVQKVNAILKQYTTDEDLLCASLLHDIIEDCYKNKWLGYKDIKSLFGRDIANIVMELTSDNEEMEHKWDRDKAAYLSYKMINMTDGALIVKLADRLQNISDAFSAEDKFRNKYFNETTKIITDLESERKLNKIQQRLSNEIKAKLTNIESTFKIKRFKDI